MSWRSLSVGRHVCTSPMSGWIAKLHPGYGSAGRAYKPARYCAVPQHPTACPVLRWALFSASPTAPLSLTQAHV